MSYPNDPYGQGGWPGSQQPDPPQPGPYQGGPPPTRQFAQQDPYGQQPYGQPQTPPGGWGQPNQGQQYGQPGQYGQQPYGQQQTPPGGWGQPGQGQQYGQQPGGWPPHDQGQHGYGGPPTPPPGVQYPTAYGEQPPPKKRTGVVIGSLVAVIALVAAGVATYVFAFQGSAAGAPSPKDAAVNLVSALSKNDVVGLLDGLAPAEGAVAKDYLTESLDQLKRLEVVKPDTKPEQITGVTFKAENLVFDDAAEERVNDHLSITKLIDGNVTISSDWSQLPLTEKFLQAAFPDGVPANETETFDISDEIAESNDGQPVRIATVKVDGEWYPSLFYSIADAALQDEGKQWPATPIAASGADSPEAAVKQLIEAAFKVDIKRVIELTPPDEMAALHDAGQLLVDEADGEEPLDATITDLQTRVEDVAGGKRVLLTRLAVENGDGDRFSIEVAGDCAKIDDNGDQQEMCGRDLAELVAEFAELGGSDLTEAQLGAIERAAIGYLHSGLVATEVDGKWYVSPARSLGDFSTGFLRAMQPGDLEALVELFN